MGGLRGKEQVTGKVLLKRFYNREDNNGEKKEYWYFIHPTKELVAAMVLVISEIKPPFNTTAVKNDQSSN